MVTTMDSRWKKNKKFPLIDQQKLKLLCDKLSDRAEDLFNFFQIEYTVNSKYITSCCPIHDGDNASALNVYYVGDTYKGNWKCRTHHCEKIFMGSIIGFIRGVLSHRKLNWRKNSDEKISFNEALKFAIEFLNIDDLSKLKVEHNPNSRFVNNTAILNNSVSTSKGISRNKVRQILDIPSSYFLSRGFSKEILDRYDVGDCITPGKEMYGRAVAPIYDHDYMGMVGCTGRTKNDEYHPKWRHNSGFNAEDHLYNLWFAKKHIQRTNEIIIVESPGNVWRLEENGVHNSVATFGAHLTDRQKMLLDISGAMKIIVIMDNDDAGQIGREQIDRKCSKTYNIEHIQISGKNDIAEMTSEEIANQIKTRIIP